MKRTHIHDIAPPVFQNLLTFVIVLKLSFFPYQSSQAPNVLENSSNGFGNVGKEITRIILAILIKVDKVNDIDHCIIGINVKAWCLKEGQTRLTK